MDPLNEDSPNESLILERKREKGEEGKVKREEGEEGKVKREEGEKEIGNEGRGKREEEEEEGKGKREERETEGRGEREEGEKKREKEGEEEENEREEGEKEGKGEREEGEKEREEGKEEREEGKEEREEGGRRIGTTLRRNPKRKHCLRNYTNDTFPKDDDYIYCEDCCKEWEGECPHHPLTLILDNPVVRDGSVSKRAHYTIPWPLTIGPSKIKSAGLGVWTNADLPKGLLFGPYQGNIISKVTSGEETGYAWKETLYPKLQVVKRLAMHGRQNVEATTTTRSTTTTTPIITTTTPIITTTTPIITTTTPIITITTSTTQAGP
ncbi:hypothetical protein Pmani_014941 [Petrolisthes manimaculis]|uniref:SET domain-containing protein n=1 Tax=Petrolisthes manimaculis TaxID=1843537 RepID=A0AAE1PT72_9EUCA|nr:hypothetical protein Pmani_014941 [Petrolisthes manimaculis]